MIFILKKTEQGNRIEIVSYLGRLQGFYNDADGRTRWWVLQRVFAISSI